MTWCSEYTTPVAVFLTLGGDLLELFGLIFETGMTDVDGPTRKVVNQPPIHNRIRTDRTRLLKRRDKRRRIAMANGRDFWVSGGPAIASYEILGRAD